MKKVLCFLFVVITTLVSTLTVFAASEKTSIEVFFNDPYRNQKDRSIQNMILECLEDAEERIDVATYNFSDTKSAAALIDAVDRGVEVNLVIEDDNYNDKVVGQLRDGGVSVVKGGSDGLMHSKYLIVDDNIVVSGSANMTLSSFSYDNNYMIRLVSPEAVKIFRAEFDEMFEDRIFGAESPHTKAAKSITLDDGSTVYIRFSPDDHIDDMIEDLIRASKESIYVLAYSFSSNDISEDIENADRDGLDVVVICEDTKAYTDGGGECGPLAEAGVNVHVDGYEDILMHEKAIILDKDVVIAGSYNYTRSADQKNDEQVLVIQSPEISDAFLKEFNKILDESK